MNFGNIPDEYSDPATARIVILPVPYDETSTWIKGADKGPQAVLEASVNMELYDIETDSEIYRTGIFTADPVTEKSSPESMLDEVYGQVKSFLNRNQFVVTIGGEHSISFAPVRAYLEKFPGLSVLQLDAHTDLRQEYEGSIYNHACVMARIREICPIVQVGIRSMDASEKSDIEPGQVFLAMDIHNRKDWITHVVNRLSDKVYITIDLDVFDPSVMPSTGTPEPGGLFWYDVLDVLRKVNKEKDIVGFDVVELCPAEGNKAPDFLASKLIYQLLSLRFNKKQNYNEKD
ncbi:MAG: agmatinase [Bacteroidia bacterium]|nr:agmatinase [Bacteroidia bacterium]